MKSRILTAALCILLIGFILSISSIITIITHKIEVGYPVQLISACLLMMCSALLVARVEFTRIETRLDESRDTWGELDVRVRGLEGKRDRPSSWRLTDLEHRVSEMEKKRED